MWLRFLIRGVPPTMIFGKAAPSRRPWASVTGSELLVEGVDLVELGRRDGDAAVSPGRLAAQHVRDARAELLVLDRVLGALGQALRGAHRRHAIDHRIDLRLDEAVAVVVRRLPQRLVAPAIGRVEPDRGREHLRVPDALGLEDVQLLDVVVGHHVHDADLKGPGLPAAAHLAALAGQDEVLRGPLTQRQRRHGAQRLHAQLHAAHDAAERDERDGLLNDGSLDHASAPSSASGKSSGSSVISCRLRTTSSAVDLIH